MVAKKPRVVIVGAGVAGLTAAHRLCTTACELFDLSIVEAGNRIGGRIFSSEFAGDKIEIGATWIHGIEGSPVYDIAQKMGALDSAHPWERMDGFPEDSVMVAEGGVAVNPSLASSISNLYKELMDTARSDKAPVAKECPSVGSFLRRGLHVHQAYRDAKEGLGGEAAAYEGGEGEWTREELEEAVFAMHENIERTYTSAADLTRLNLATEKEYCEFPGDQISIAKGYSRVIESLAAAIPPGLIHLGKKVHRIEWSPGGGPAAVDDGPVRLHLEDHTILPADHVIVTVSLGVLKATMNKEEAGGFKEFSPELPAFKREAIQRLGFGVVNKLFMELDGEERFPFLEMVFDKGEEGGSRRRVAEIPWWMRRTASICPIYGGSRVLLAWLSGKEAMELESLEDDEIIRGIHATLDAFSISAKGAGYANESQRCNGNAATNHGRITKVLRSRWGKDPLFLGTYSYVAVGSSGDDLDLMAKPLPSDDGEDDAGGPPLQVLFAGEATHRTHYSTTHGAYFSGIREANRLIQHYHKASTITTTTAT